MTNLLWTAIAVRQCPISLLAIGSSFARTTSPDVSDQRERT
jgi:hypothetical protein